MNEKPFEICDIIFLSPRESNTLGVGTLFQTVDGKYYGLFMEPDGTLRLKETQIIKTISLEPYPDEEANKKAVKPKPKWYHFFVGKQ